MKPEEMRLRMTTIGDLLVVQFPDTVFSLAILSEGKISHCHSADSAETIVEVLRELADKLS